MAENNLYSKDRHEWQAVNRSAKRDAALKNYINTDPRVLEEYGSLITQFELWRVETFGVEASVEGTEGEIVGRPNEIFPITYQEWSGTIPFDTQIPNPLQPGKKTGKWKPIVANRATLLRKAVSDAIHAFRAGANINRTQPEDQNPGEGRNAAGEVIVGPIDEENGEDPDPTPPPAPDPEAPQTFPGDGTTHRTSPTVGEYGDLNNNGQYDTGEPLYP